MLEGDLVLRLHELHSILLVVCILFPSPWSFAPTLDPDGDQSSFLEGDPGSEHWEEYQSSDQLGSPIEMGFLS